MMAVRGLEHDKIVQMLFSKTTPDPDIKDKVRLWGAEAHFLFGNMLGREKRREEDKVASVSPVVRDFDASPCHVRTAVVVPVELQAGLLSLCTVTLQVDTGNNSFSAPTNTVLTTVPAGRQDGPHDVVPCA